MKQKGIIYLLYGIVSLLCFTSCDKADNADGWQFEFQAPKFDTNTDLGKIRKELYDTYKVNFTSEFDDMFYSFDWMNTFDAYQKIEVSPNEHSYTADYLKEVKKVLEKLPDFLLRHLPSHVLLVDSLRNQYTISYSSKPVSEQVRSVVGDSKTNFIVFAFCGESFPLQNLVELRESWTELFFERALTNYTAPTEFQQIVLAQKNGLQKGYDLTATWKSTINMTKFGFLEDSHARRTKFTAGSANVKGETTQLNYNGNMREYQDLALFIAFTMYRPATEKAKIYAISDLFSQKEEIVKSFCANTLGFELKSQINNIH